MATQARQVRFGADACCLGMLLRRVLLIAGCDDHVEPHMRKCSGGEVGYHSG